MGKAVCRNFLDSVRDLPKCDHPLWPRQTRRLNHSWGRDSRGCVQSCATGAVGGWRVDSESCHDDSPQRIVFVFVMFQRWWTFCDVSCIAELSISFGSKCCVVCVQLAQGLGHPPWKLGSVVVSINRPCVSMVWAIVRVDTPAIFLISRWPSRLDSTVELECKQQGVGGVRIT